MGKNYNWRIKQKYYNLINKSIKHVFKSRKSANDIKIYTLSSLINNCKDFRKFAQAVYSITEYSCKDYPKYFEWYWTKEIPRVFNGTGEIIICTISNKIAGVACLKKDDTESKLCTFFVAEEYRGKGIATKMLKQSFRYLGTTKPLFTIADNKISMFKHIIKKYNWKLTQIMDKGYYNTTSRELVYNGKLPEPK